MDDVSCKDRLREEMLNKVMQETSEVILGTKTRCASTQEILHFS